MTAKLIAPVVAHMEDIPPVVTALPLVLRWTLN